MGVGIIGLCGPVHHFTLHPSDSSFTNAQCVKLAHSFLHRRGFIFIYLALRGLLFSTTYDTVAAPVSTTGSTFVNDSRGLKRKPNKCAFSSTSANFRQNA